MEKVKIAICQKNFTVGDLEKNYRTIIDSRSYCQSKGVDLCVFSELCISGYPPEDLVLRPEFIKSNKKILQRLVDNSNSEGPAIIVGFPREEKGRIYNSAVLIEKGNSYIIDKFHLPNYGVFDEERVFNRGNMSGPISIRGLRIGLMICEDMWHSDVSESLLESGAQLLIVINGSPFDQQKEDERLSVAIARVTETALPLLYVNQVGGQDEVVFDGASFFLDSNCKLSSQSPSWKEDITINNVQFEDNGVQNISTNKLNKISYGIEAKYQAMVMGLSEYINKNNFNGIVLGLSGGIDSALSAAIAVDALGKNNVRGIRMPSIISSEGSLIEAKQTAELLNINLETIPISRLVNNYEIELNKLFSRSTKKDSTEENIQSRIRGVILMAISNKFGEMLLSTGNKSEISVGYTTIYGDMNGGFNVLKDAYKTDVYSLAEWRNKNYQSNFKGPKGKAIPENSIKKPPSAELSPDQKDEDSLPPYDILDQILKELIEEEKSISEIVEIGFEKELVKKIYKLVLLSEYKRRQSPPGVKLTGRSFGKERRYPVTNAYYEE